MTKKEISTQIDKNREEINRLLHVDLPIDVIYHNVRILSSRNERLINQLKERKDEKYL